MNAAAGDLRRVLGDTFTHGEARQAAVSDKRRSRSAKAGELVTLGGGVYLWADAPPADDDLVEITERVPMGTLCLETALARHGLTDAIPAAIDIAIPRGSTRPALRAPVRLHQFDPRTFELGRDLLDVGARRPLGIYSAERSIVDVVRLRHREGSDMAWKGCGGGWPSPGGALHSSSSSPSGCHARNRLCGMRWRCCSSPRRTRATTAGRAYLDLRKKARQDRRPVDELMQLYVLESFLARMSSTRAADPARRGTPSRPERRSGARSP